MLRAEESSNFSMEGCSEPNCFGVDDFAEDLFIDLDLLLGDEGHDDGSEDLQVWLFFGAILMENLWNGSDFAFCDVYYGLCEIFFFLLLYRALLLRHRKEDIELFELF